LAPITVKFDPVVAKTLPTFAVMTQTPLAGTIMVAVVATVIDPVQVTALEGGHRLEPRGVPMHESTSSGLDGAKVAKFPHSVENFSAYAAPELSCPVLDWNVGTAQMKTIEDRTITISSMSTSATIVLSPILERNSEGGKVDLE